MVVGLRASGWKCRDSGVEMRAEGSGQSVEGVVFIVVLLRIGCTRAVYHHNESSHQGCVTPKVAEIQAKRGRNWSHFRWRKDRPSRSTTLPLSPSADAANGSKNAARSVPPPTPSPWRESRGASGVRCSGWRFSHFTLLLPRLVPACSITCYMYY